MTTRPFTVVLTRIEFAVRFDTWIPPSCMVSFAQTREPRGAGVTMGGTDGLLVQKPACPRDGFRAQPNCGTQLGD